MIYAADKIEQAENHMAHSSYGSLVIAPQRKKEVSELFPLSLLYSWSQLEFVYSFPG